MDNAVLLSGATGFVGSAIAEELVLTTDATIRALVRPRPGRTGYQRLQSLWCERPVLAAALGDRIQVVEGDIEHALLGLDPARFDELAYTTDIVIHAAAEVGINETRQRLWDVNVVGTHHMLEFARRANDLGGLRRFVHLSTAYVAGRLTGQIPERLFGDDRYNSLYEQSKHEGELLVSGYADVFPYTIVRPSQIVGDTRTGFVARFNTLYYPLKVYLRSGLRVIPAAPSLRVNMVPVDYVAHLACRAAVEADQPAAQVVNAVGRPDELPTLGELMDAVRAWAHDHLSLDLPAPRYLPLPGLGTLGSARNLRTSARPKRKGPLRNLLTLAPYFLEDRSFAVEGARRLADRPFPDWHDYLPRLLGYATRRAFLDYTDRTVGEQVLMRLRPGASTRFDYFDVGARGIEHHAGTDVRADILEIAHALRAYGVEGGTRVATLGINSVRYLALDVAIGLVGAIDVPIYYTSPATDVVALVETSGSKLLFVGTDRILDALDVDALGAHVVALGDRSDLPEGIESWADFLARGTAAQGAGAAEFCGSAKGAAPAHLDAAAGLPYVAPQQTATIRYTSGTTGQPKGVVFSQQQIRWMGEVMPAVLDWRTRTAPKIRYLSFLPMSHVVEGILVAYAPYYILSDIEMYYLNDFPRLAEVLPQVRPNLFFSVPRFYEKVWNQFAATGAGRLWIRLPDGPLKRLLAWPLRYVVLRKAGLDRCRQLIVGSAPIGMELLESFRSLGVEIHNAFGVTEAPLVTLSPLGKNELGSVGHLLPDTEARLDDEGLVYVRGPQVTRGYDGQDEPAVDADGWFCTGDLGSWSAEGNLVLGGRKKEILVTSYGKNIAPQKIEVLLKGIDGVSEAMVVADGRPYTTALLWLEDEVASALAAQSDGELFDFAELDAAVVRINEQLSHPEQLKRWVVCARPLTVASGELTPNLKVRRTVVAETRADLIGELYGTAGGRPAQGGRAEGLADVGPDAALHWGATR